MCVCVCVHAKCALNCHIRHRTTCKKHTHTRQNTLYKIVGVETNVSRSVCVCVWRSVLCACEMCASYGGVGVSAGGGANRTPRPPILHELKVQEAHTRPNTLSKIVLGVAEVSFEFICAYSTRN